MDYPRLRSVLFYVLVLWGHFIVLYKLWTEGIWPIGMQLLVIYFVLLFIYKPELFGMRALIERVRDWSNNSENILKSSQMARILS